ncbi:ribonuclease M5 [Suicoccus acidiformans]|uniref:Ribonuclease M5 n=1 Tax=Suicoccus acidiformans TaxID=2036206 RepID=A0A347WN89_9LACT|nr:ribonuclease M5 [Suicoccus acidiformans]AXY26546.1 ribonuclease M5 [Suicoccus acidiformans]
MIREVPQEVIVVEGKADTQRLQVTFGPEVKTIETNGSEISLATLEEIAQAQRLFGVIVLTDPDFQGERIRRLVQAHVPDVAHAYIKREEGRGRHASDSLGIEHASPEAIRGALANRITPQVQGVAGESFTTADLQALGLVGSASAASRRQYIAEYFHIGPVNGKQLKRKLERYQISYQAVCEALEKGGYHVNKS